MELPQKLKEYLKLMKVLYWLLVWPIIILLYIFFSFELAIIVYLTLLITLMLMRQMPLMIWIYKDALKISQNKRWSLENALMAIGDRFILDPFYNGHYSNGGHYILCKELLLNNGRIKYFKDYYTFERNIIWLFIIGLVLIFIFAGIDYFFHFGILDFLIATSAS